jgi:ParB-like chromosome segregation protein Spo0J
MLTSTVFDAESLQDLANSIKEHGIFHPLCLVQFGGAD